MTSRKAAIHFARCLNQVLRRPERKLYLTGLGLANGLFDLDSGAPRGLSATCYCERVELGGRNTLTEERALCLLSPAVELLILCKTTVSTRFASLEYKRQTYHPHSQHLRPESPMNKLHRKRPTRISRKSVTHHLLVLQPPK
jgi:hypothetical protein